MGKKERTRTPPALVKSKVKGKPRWFARSGCFAPDTWKQIVSFPGFKKNFAWTRRQGIQERTKCYFTTLRSPMSKRQKDWEKDIEKEFKNMGFDQPMTKKEVKELALTKRYRKEAKELQKIHDEAIDSRFQTGFGLAGGD